MKNKEKQIERLQGLMKGDELVVEDIQAIRYATAFMQSGKEIPLETVVREKIAKETQGFEIIEKDDRVLLENEDFDITIYNDGEISIEAKIAGYGRVGLTLPFNLINKYISNFTA